MFFQEVGITALKCCQRILPSPTSEITKYQNIFLGQGSLKQKGFFEHIFKNIYLLPSVGAFFF